MSYRNDNYSGISSGYETETARLFDKSRYGGSGECFSMSMAYDAAIRDMRRSFYSQLFEKCHKAHSAVDFSARTDRKAQTITIELEVDGAVVVSETTSIYQTRCGREHEALVKRLVERAVALFAI